MSVKTLLIAGLSLLFLTAWPDFAAAQRFGGSPKRMFRWLDQNENGTLEMDELQRFPPLRDFIENRGIDASRSLSPEEFSNLMGDFRQEMQQRMESGGLGGPSGLGRREAESDTADAEAPRVRIRSFGGGSGGGGFGGGFASSDESDQDSPPSSPAPEKKSIPATLKPRVSTSLKLPEAYRSKDKNGDGQIGLYEWPRSDLAAFRKLDRNGDGFLTPQELTTGPLKAVASSGASDAKGGTSSPAATSGTTTPSTATTSTGSSGAAETAFSLLDKDKNGTVSSEEWDRSLSVRPKFEKQNLKPSLPINKDEFLKFHQQLKPT